MPTHYTTVQQCRAAAAQALVGNTDLDFPSIAADCRASGPQLAKTATKTPRG